MTAKIGAKEMIAALDYEIRGMKPGGIRVIEAEPGVIFGPFGNGSLRGDTPCKFTVKLLSINGNKS